MRFQRLTEGCYDSSMFIQFNPNPKSNRVGDCVIRAICKVTDKSWDEVYSDICLEGFIQKDMPSSNAVWGMYLIRNGFLRMPAPNTCPHCYTVIDFCKDHPQGKYVLATGSHVIASIDGNYYDSWDSGQEVVAYIFKEVSHV